MFELTGSVDGDRHRLHGSERRINQHIGRARVAGELRRVRCDIRQTEKIQTRKPRKLRFAIHNVGIANSVYRPLWTEQSVVQIPPAGGEHIADSPAIAQRQTNQQTFRRGCCRTQWCGDSDRERLQPTLGRIRRAGSGVHANAAQRAEEIHNRRRSTCGTLQNLTS